MELENIILIEVTKLQKNRHDMHSLISEYYPQKFRIPKIQFTDHMKLKKKEDQCMDTAVLLTGEQSPHGRIYREKLWGI